MKYKHVGILLVIVAAVSAAVTRYYYPKIEYKNQEVIVEVIKTDVRTIIKEIIRPDGTKETITDTTDKSTRKETEKKQTLIFGKSQWFFGLTAQKDFKSSDLGYQLSVAKRQVGPFYLIGQLGYKKNETSIGAGIGMEF